MSKNNKLFKKPELSNKFVNLIFFGTTQVLAYADDANITSDDIRTIERKVYVIKCLYGYCSSSKHRKK